MKRWLIALLLAPVMLSCTSSTEVDDPQPATGPLPSYESIRDAHNARVQLLDRIWASTNVRVYYKDEEGNDRSERLDGSLQVVQPGRLLMTFNKVGELFFIIGSNLEQYWWIRLGSDKQASVGRYENADERTVARLELAVHPLDFIELLAITPLPESGTPAWADGLVRLQVPARWGSRVLFIDPDTLEPVRVEMLDGQAEIVASSTLTRYIDVDVERSVDGRQPRLPQRFWVESAKQDLSVKVDIYRPVSSDRRPAPDIFDFDRIVSMYRVRTIVDLDEGS